MVSNELSIGYQINTATEPI